MRNVLLEICFLIALHPIKIRYYENEMGKKQGCVFTVENEEQAEPSVVPWSDRIWPLDREVGFPDNV